VSNRLVILTGASRGLGAALLRQLLADGTHVLAAARGSAPSDLPAAGRLDWRSVDLADAKAGADWIAEALRACPRPDGASLILNAGAVEPVLPVAALEPAAIEAHLALNLAGPMAQTASFLRATEAWGIERRILAISSGAGRRGVAHWSAYCAAKAGLDNFIRALNAEQGARVRAVSLAPGVVDTAMQATLRASDFPDLPRFRDLHAGGGLAKPEDAARLILRYLGSDAFGTTETDDVRNL